MKKRSTAKSIQIEPTKKFMASIKNFSTARKSQIIPTNKLKTSTNNNTNRSNNAPSTTTKNRKSVVITTTKKKSINPNNIDIKRKKSIMKKPEAKSVKKDTDKKKASAMKRNTVIIKPSSMSVSLKKDNIGKNQKRFSNVQNVNLFNSGKNKNKSKTTKKSVEINDIVDEEDIISSKENQNFKDLKNSQAFNKNESIGINILNNINDENENNNEDNNVILENEKEKNLTAEKPNNDTNKKENNKLNIPIQNELIKEKIEGGFINGNIFNENQEKKLKNKKVETSDFISEKNKNTMRNLLYLLERKPEENKNQKSLFRSSLNSLEKREKNKLLDIVYQNKKKIYKMKLEDEIKKKNSLNSVNLIKNPNPLDALNEIGKIDKIPNKQDLFILKDYEDKYQNMKNKYLMMVSTPNPRKQFPTFYHEKYFIDYVEGKCPNLDILERTMKYEKNMHNENNNKIGTISESHKFSKSYNNKFHFMEKNDLSVEKRDNRYMYYNYRFMVNTIDDKLNGYINGEDFRHSFQPLHKNNSDFGLNKGYRDSNPNPRVSKLYNDINSIASQEYGRKTYFERNPFL